MIGTSFSGMQHLPQTVSKNFLVFSEIRLKEYGRESIEVIDNGSGVEERNIHGLSETPHSNYRSLLSV